MLRVARDEHEVTGFDSSGFVADSELTLSFHREHESTPMFRCRHILDVESDGDLGSRRASMADTALPTSS